MNVTLSKLTRRWAIPVLFAACLAGCATGEFGGSGVSSTERRAGNLAAAGQHADAAGLYIGLASSAAGGERERLTLLAAEQWLDAGDGRRAKTAMQDVAMPAGGELRWIWNTNRAAIELWEGRPDGALNILEPMSAEPLPTRHRLRAQALRADAWFQKDDPLRAISLYAQRESMLSDERDVQANRARLWAGLLVSDVQTLRRMAGATADPIARGWLSLGALGASTGQQGIGWNNGVVRWQETNFNHPAMSILDDTRIADQDMLDYPREIALLLPLSGRNASAGNAVQNGFFGAYYGASAGLDDVQQVRVYDVVAAGGANAAYVQAVADGAQFVVGPLLRGSVNALAAEELMPVPVLALNNLPDNTLAPPGLFQFALSPEDEAAAAAERAIADGRSLGLAMVPNNDWGRRLLNSFADEFQARGGSLLEYRFYEPSDQDFSFEIQNLMGLSLSQQRYTRLRANLGGTLEFDPRRRADAEFLFLAAAAPVGRLIKSQLKFHYSGGLPVYSTSRIFAMDGRSNSDLNGVMFADTPWVIAPQPWIAELPSLYSEYWPNERRLGRLHAMGYDAYLLLGELFASRGREMTPIDGASGSLYLDPAGRVHRRLPWARFQGGEPVSLTSPADRPRGLDGGGIGSDYPMPSAPETRPDGGAGESVFPILER